MEALALEPAARRRFARHRVHWPAVLTLEGGDELAGITRDYCVGGAYLAVGKRPDARALPGAGARGRLRISPAGAPPASITVEIRQTSGEGVGLMFLDAAAADTDRLLSEATRPPTPAAETPLEHKELRATLRGQLERNLQHWGPLWVAALKQRLFRIAAEAPSSLQHRLMDVHQTFEREAPRNLTRSLEQVLARFDDPTLRSGEAEPTPTAAGGELTLSLIDNDAFEDFLAEADLASRVEAAHRSLLFRLNAMLVAALGSAFDVSEGPLSPRTLVRALWSMVQGQTREMAVRQMAQSIFNELFVSRIGEFYGDCARRLVEAGFEAEAEPRPLPRRGEVRVVAETSDQPQQQEPPPEPVQPAISGPVSTPGFAAGSAAASAGAVPAAMGQMPGQWPVAPGSESPFERTLGQPGVGFMGRGEEAVSAPMAVGQVQAHALTRLYNRLMPGVPGAGTCVASDHVPQATRAQAAAGTGWPDAPRGAGLAHAYTQMQPTAPGPALSPSTGAIRAAAAESNAVLVPYADLPQPAAAVAGHFVDDFLTGLVADPRVGPVQRAALGDLRGSVLPAVAHDPSVLTDPTHPVRRLASALSRLVWVEGEQAVTPCGLSVSELLERLSVPGQASPAMFLEVARELEATLVTQREAVAAASASLVTRHAEALALVQSRRRPEEEHGSLSEQVPEALLPWFSRARALRVGDEVLLRRPKQADELLRLVWVGDEQRQFAFTDPAAERLHGMTLRELALQLMRGRIVPVAVTEEPVAQALLSMVDAADARLQAAAVIDAESGLWNEVGLLRELDGLVPQCGATGASLDAQLARWRGLGKAASDCSDVIEMLRCSLPENSRCARLEDGDLLAYAPPGCSEKAAWKAAMRAVAAQLEADTRLPRLRVALRHFRPGAELPQAVLERLSIALAGGDPDRQLIADPEVLRAALAGGAEYGLVSDLAPVRMGNDDQTAPVALALVPRLLDGLQVEAASVNTDASLARAWDHWMLEEVIARASAADVDAQTLWFVPMSDPALDDETFVEHVGERLLASGVSPSRLMLELGLTHEGQHETLQNRVAGLRAFGCGVALRFRHGTGLTAALLRRAGVSCLHLPDWLSEAGPRSPERALLIQSLVDLCRFIDVPSLAVTPPGEPADAELRSLGVDWLLPLAATADGTVRLIRREDPATNS